MKIDFQENASTIITIVYGSSMFIVFMVAVIKGYIDTTKRIAKDTNVYVKMSCCGKFLDWILYTIKLRSMYYAAILHIYDMASDVGVMVEWYQPAFGYLKNDPINDNIDMPLFFILSLAAFFAYKVVSTVLVWRNTHKCKTIIEQFFDVLIFRIIYINHTLERKEPGNLHRWLRCTYTYKVHKKI